MRRRFLKKKIQVIEKKYHKDIFKTEQTDFTHGDLLRKIFFRHPHLKWVSVVVTKEGDLKNRKREYKSLQRVMSTPMNISLYIHIRTSMWRLRKRCCFQISNK